MKNLEKYRSVLTAEVQGLFLTSRYSRMYAAEFDIAEAVSYTHLTLPTKA